MPQFHCPHCGQHIDADDEFAGAEADCPSCEKVIQVPKAGSDPVAMQTRVPQEPDTLDRDLSSDEGRAAMPPEPPAVESAREQVTFDRASLSLPLRAFPPPLRASGPPPPPPQPHQKRLRQAPPPPPAPGSFVHLPVPSLAPASAPLPPPPPLMTKGAPGPVWMETGGSTVGWILVAVAGLVILVSCLAIWSRTNSGTLPLVAPASSPTPGSGLAPSSDISSPVLPSVYGLTPWGAEGEQEVSFLFFNANGPDFYRISSLSIPEIEALAAQGDSNAHCVLGTIFMHGLRGHAVNVPKAESYFIAAASRRSLFAQATLAYHFAYDETDRNDAESLYWARMAAKSGHPLGLLIAGSVGISVHHDGNSPREAIGWLQQAAAAGVGSACYLLGALYIEGTSEVLPDISKAWTWHSRGAELDYVGCLHAAATMVSKGNGTSRSMVEAIRLWHLAAEQGHIDSQFALATALTKEGASANEVIEACVWMCLAAKNDRAADHLSQNLTAGQRAEVAARVAAFKPRQRQINITFPRSGS